MSIWAVTLGLAIVTVLATRGSFFALARIRLRALWLLVVAAVIQIGLALVSIPDARIDDVGFGLLMTSYVLLLAFCFANLGLRGMGIVVVGVAMNAVVIGLNQGMPATEKVWRDGRVVEEPFERSVKHKPATDDDLLPFLGDIILLPQMFNEVVSFGDLVLAIGIIDVTFWGSRKRRRETAVDEAAERAAARRRRRARRRAARRDVLAPEPVFIDLTEPEPLPERRPERFPEREPVPTFPSSEAPPAAAGVDAARGEPSERPPIEWRAPPQDSIDLSEYDRRAPARRERSGSVGRDGDAAALEQPLEGVQDPSVVDVRRP